MCAKTCVNECEITIYYCIHCNQKLKMKSPNAVSMYSLLKHQTMTYDRDSQGSLLSSAKAIPKTTNMTKSVMRTMVTNWDLNIEHS